MFSFHFQEQGHLQAVLSCLTGRQIADACELAQKSGDHKLALLLAQAVSNFLPRQMLSKQLDEWNELGVSLYIHLHMGRSFLDYFCIKDFEADFEDI